MLPVIIIIAIVSSLSAPALAASETWDGDQNTGVWATVLNWAEAGVVPGTGDTATFNSAGGTVDLINLGGGVTLGTLLFDNAACTAYTIGSVAGQTLTLNNGGGITVNLGVVQTQTIAANILLAPDFSNATFSNNGANDGFLLNVTGNVTSQAPGADTLTLRGTDTGNNLVSGVISNGVGGGTLAVTKDDAGKWIISGINTYTGVTTVGAGTLVATNSASALGAGTLTMSGGKLQLANDSNLAFNRNTTVTASSEIDSIRVLAAGAGTTHTLGTLSIGAFTLTAGIGDALTTSGVQGLTFGAVTLTGDAVINAAGGYGGTATGLLTLGDVTSGGNKLTLSSNSTVAITMGTMANLGGAGNGLTITGAGGLVTVGTIGNGATGEVTITDSSAGVNFSGAVTATTVTLTDTTDAANITFTGALITPTLTTAAQAYDLDLLGSGTTITNDCTLLNTGILTLGDVAGDTITFTGGLDTAAVTGGTRIAGTVATTNTQMDLGATTLTAASSLTSGGGVINVASVVNGGFLLTVNAGAGASAIAGVVGGTGGLTKAGAGTLTLSGANTYTGVTTVNAGKVSIAADSGLGTAPGGVVATQITLGGGTLESSGTFTLNSNRGITLTADSTMDVDPAATLTYSGIITGAFALTKADTGILALGGANTYTGATNINAGTLRVSNASALGAGAAANVAHNTASTLDIGSTTLNIGGTYTQAGAAILMVAVNGTTSGSIVSGGAATVPTTASLVLAVSNYVPNNTTYTIINGTGGAGVAAPAITVTGDNRATFSATTVGEDLILTASRAANGFASDATTGDSNASAVGTVLDTITNPSGDMSTVLNTMEGLSNSQVASALDTMVPEIDGGVINTSTTVLNNFVGVSIDRAENVMTLAKAADSAATGVSAGEAGKISGIWGKGYGSYLTQGTRKGIQGYDAWNAGTALGADHLFSDVLTLGVSGGYAYGNVDSDVNSANTYINSAQTTVYGGYEDRNLPFFIDAAGSFAWNWYQGQRDINVGNVILRTANADYDGQQYGAYIGGGYKFDVTKNIEFTPLASLQYNHLQLESYTETEAGALSLSVASQDYDQLQSGLGARIAAPMKCKWGTLTPEAHGKWFYDFIGDSMVVASTFTGGGASFNSNGAKPALNSYNAGGQLTFDLKNDISVIASCDTEIKDEFFGIYGSATARYNF